MYSNVRKTFFLILHQRETWSFCNYFRGAKPFLENRSINQEFPCRLKPKVSLRCTQEPAMCPHFEPDERSPCSISHFIIIIQSTPRYFNWPRPFIASDWHVVILPFTSLTFHDPWFCWHYIVKRQILWSPFSVISPSCSYFLSLGHKYSPWHFVPR
jgi:hypothetical protein